MNKQVVERVSQEIEILKREIGGGGVGGERVKMGKVQIQANQYLGVIIKNLGVNPAIFQGVKSLNALLLLPESYPKTPPIGCYVDRPYTVQNSHFVRTGYHGAPTLEAQGWRWFCHGVGGFSGQGQQGTWRPSPDPGDGHNLATVLAASRVAMNTKC